MCDFQKDIINIIYAALTGEKKGISKKFDIEKGINLAREHNIIALFYEGIILCGFSPDMPVLKNLQSELYISVMKDVRQKYMIKEISKRFDDDNIDYLPLKGTILKAIYPKSAMRTMGDADILIKEEQYEKISEILTTLEFSFIKETDHELVWRHPSLLLELHKRVMTTYNKDFYKYFDTGWSFAKKIEGTNSRYEFNPEDFYIYIFVHFTKHYRISGIGIKHILDLWVYKKAYFNMNKEYIDKKLVELNLSEFHKNVMDTLDVWFNDGEANDKTALITNVIFSSGQYGSEEMAIINRVIRASVNSGSIEKTKIKNIFSVLFLSLDNMRKEYPLLTKMPFLLPFMWIVRGADVLLLRKENLKKYFKGVKTINKTNVEENQNALSFVGLEFRE